MRARLVDDLREVARGWRWTRRPLVPRSAEPFQPRRVPAEFPTACSPQAWASGTPLLFLRVLLGLRPTPDKLEVDPHVPDWVGHLALRGIPGRWGRTDAVAPAVPG